MTYKRTKGGGGGGGGCSSAGCLMNTMYILHSLLFATPGLSLYPFLTCEHVQFHFLYKHVCHCFKATAPISVFRTNEQSVKIDGLLSELK